MTTPLDPAAARLWPSQPDVDDGTEASEDTPRPGSPEAFALGCRCPEFDNARGRGAWGTSGADAVFWVQADCPVHGQKGESGCDD